MHDRTHSPHKLIAHRMKDNDQSFLITGLFHFFLQHFFNHFRRNFLTLQTTKRVVHFLLCIVYNELAYFQ